MDGFGDSLGPLIIGPFITTFLYGVSTLQTYIYFTRHAADTREMKLWVSTIWIVDTTQVILVTYGVYFWVHGHILPHIDNAFSDQGKRAMEASSGMNLLIAFLVQCFFVKRICQLSRDRYKYWLLTGLVLLVITHLVLGSEAIVKVIDALKLHSSVVLPSLTASVITPFTVAAVLSDLCLAIALIMLLRSRRSDLEHMNSVIDRAVNYLFTRCLLVTAGALVRLITFAALPNSTWYIAIDVIIGKLYSNSLLAMLNSRQPTTRASQDTELQSTSGQLFTTVVDIPHAGPESTGASGQTTTFAQRISGHQSSAVDNADTHANEVYKSDSSGIQSHVTVPFPG